MIGYDHTNTDSKSVIQCTGSLGFAFIDVTTLKIAKLIFSFCGASLNFTVNKFPTKGSKMTFFFLRTTNVTIFQVAINNSTEAGLIGINMFGLSNISHTVFRGNRPNCLLIYQELFKLNLVPPTDLNIANLQVTFGEKPKHLKSYRSWGATGLGIFLTQTTYKVFVHMNHLKTYNNMKKEHWNGNLRLVITNWECPSSVIQAKNIISTNIEKTHDKTWLYLQYMSKKRGSLPRCKFVKTAEQKYRVHISDSHFDGMIIRVNTNVKYCDARIKLQNITTQDTLFHISKMKNIEMQDVIGQRSGMSADDSNITTFGSCYFMHVRNKQRSLVSLFRSNISFHNVKFIDNKVHQDTVLLGNNSTIKFQHVAELVGNQGRVGGATALYNSSQLIFEKQSNVNFLGNYAQLYGGAILVDKSIIVVEPEARVVFIENEAYDGGAIAFQNDARIMLKSQSQITFTRNHAQQYGGALYVEEPTPEIKFHIHSYKIRCFFNLPPHLNAIPRLMFANNTADTAGSILYGGWIEFCTNSTGKPGTDVFNEMFHFQKALHQLSPVSSNPTRVCVCINNHPDCSITNYNVTVYPGETFQIPAVAVGQMFGTVPFTVNSRFSSVNSRMALPTRASASRPPAQAPRSTPAERPCR